MKIIMVGSRFAPVPISLCAQLSWHGLTGESPVVVIPGNHVAYTQLQQRCCMLKRYVKLYIRGIYLLVEAKYLMLGWAN